jgi:hypothetical protein
MKKSRKEGLKKLTLHRETLACLDQLQLSAAPGAGFCNASASCPPPSTQACSDSCNLPCF